MQDNAVFDPERDADFTHTPSGPPSGSAEAVVRTVGQRLGVAFGRSVIIENSSNRLPRFAWVRFSVLIQPPFRFGLRRAVTIRLAAPKWAVGDAMKPKQFILIVVIAFVMVGLWGLARCVLDPVEAWPSMESQENMHSEHLSHSTAFASISSRFG